MRHRRRGHGNITVDISLVPLRPALQRFLACDTLDMFQKKPDGFTNHFQAAHFRHYSQHMSGVQPLTTALPDQAGLPQPSEQSIEPDACRAPIQQSIPKLAQATVIETQSNVNDRNASIIRAFFSAGY